MPKGSPQWLTYEAWGKTYSESNVDRCRSIYLVLTNMIDTEIIHLDLFGTSLVVLNTMKAAQTIFETHGNIQSGR